MTLPFASRTGLKKTPWILAAEVQVRATGKALAVMTGEAVIKETIVTF